MLSIAALIAVIAVAALAADPTWGEVHSKKTGVVAVHASASGTNTYVDIPYDGHTPFRIVEVTAYKDGVTTNVTLDRLWKLSVPRLAAEITTDYLGNTVTNKYPAGHQITIQTNRIYDSSSDTLPTSAYVIGGETIRATFDTTNTVLRIIGTAN
jgi:hypothetical protein